ncbi:MAG TPA: winged helix DNA-binding domain-containing protein, partial [Solirubrobacteraceae bacterium]|nr:winged helix DNA-binding domain-containing protein [Solirubrobacteraceae bacterium]
IQGQDPRGARLAIRARSSGLTAADVDRALGERALLITWLCRGTLHLVRREDYPWLHALTAPRLLTGNTRRLTQEGVSAAAAERGVGVIERSLAREGPLTRPQLRERLDTAGVPTAGQALVHLLMLASLRGLSVRGPMLGGEHAHVLVHDWLGAAAQTEREHALTGAGRAGALAELARRYLAGHGPADERDLARWAGITLRDARAGLQAIAAELAPRGHGLVALARATAAPALPPPRLLGAFDPVLLGWSTREPILGPHTRIVTVNGLFRPFALADGRAVAIWSMAKGQVKIEPLGRISGAVNTALHDEARDVERYLRPG